MKRIIKFRCWNPLMKEMLDDHYLKCHNMTYAFSSFNLEHLNFMQFTGLKDKNGKEIYEGDIINLHVFTEELGEGYGVVEGEKEYVGEMFIAEFGTAFKLGKEEDDWFYLLNVNGMIHEESFEVLGNICENQELLKL